MTFYEKVIKITQETEIDNIRFAAFAADTGDTTVKGRGHLYIIWNSQRIQEYSKAYPNMVINGHIINHDHLSNFIASGEWKKC